MIAETETEPERYNVYTNPKTNPQRNPNVDPKRTKPLTGKEVSAIKRGHEQYSEMGPWNLSIILSNTKCVHVSTMSIYRVLYPEKYKTVMVDAEKDTTKFFEKHRPHAMYHADTMEVYLANGKKIFQISIEDDYSRGYMALCVFKHKHPYFVVITILRACRLHSIPHLFHHDNGGEYNNGVVARLLEMLGIVDVPTKVRNPKGNGKKENGHKQDRRYFYEKKQFQNIESVKQEIPDYLILHNEIKGQWARYGRTVASILEGAEKNPLTDGELDKVIHELFFKKVKRLVKRNGKIKFESKWYHIGKRMRGETISMRITLKGLEAWHNGIFLKRWKYWEYVLHIDANYTIEKYLL